MSERPLSRILSRLEELGCRPIGRNGTWQAFCPGHADGRRRGLSIREAEDGKMLVHCHHGRPTEEVLAALGLSWADLFPPGEQRRNGSDQRQQRQAQKPGDPLTWWAERSGVPLSWLKTLPLETRDRAVGFRWPGLETVKLRRSDSKGWWEPEDGPRPPLWPALPDEAPQVLVLCEGESDATTARYIIEALKLEPLASAHGVTKGAAARPDPSLLWELVAKGFRALLLVPDVDEVGQKWARAWTEAARQAGLVTQVFDLVNKGLVAPSLGEKDLRDAFRRQPTKTMAALKETIEALAEAPSGFVSIKDTSVETKRDREVRAADLQAQAREEGRALRYLPLLGREGYIVEGFTHLISGYAKAGKTHLLAQVVGEWHEPVLWFTEEPRAVWEARLACLPDAYHHLTLYFALGCPRQDLLERIAQGQEAVVIIDTSKLLGIADPDDAGEVTAVLAPVIASCREAGKTLILVHHERKGGGQHGEGIAGSHAFLALVDIALELLRDDKHPRRRIIRGYGRIVSVPELCYEMADDGALVPLGDPEELALAQVKERALSLLTEEWQLLKDIMAALGDPRPSEDQVRRGLNALVEEGKAERDPPLGTKGNKAHRWRLASVPFGFDGHTFNQNETEPVAQEEGGLAEEDRGSFVRQEPPSRFDGQSELISKASKR